MRLRLIRGRNWWPKRGVGRKAAGGAGRPPDARGVSQTTGLESGPPPRARGQHGSHRKVPAEENRWPSRGMRPGQIPADRAGSRVRPQAATATAVSQASTRQAATSQASTRQAASAQPRTSQAATSQAAASRTAGRAAIRTAPGAPGTAPAGRSNAASSAASARQRQQHPAAAADAKPWYAIARPTRPDAGRRHCGCLEEVLIREWEAEAEPAPECVTAVNRLADLPLLIKEKLAAGLDAIHIGAGGVPDLDDMGALAGVPLPSGRSTWDACAGAYGDRKIIVGSRPSPTPDVMCHEVGHALDDLDGPNGGWQSDSTDFRALHGRCLPHLTSEVRRNGEELGRREFFADAFAAIASGQRPALVEMLSGDTRTALDVMLYFNVRYGM
jgi:hypothetical protein